MIFYTSDLHIGHSNIIKLNNRPFSSVEEMNNVIIRNYQETVSNNDDVYILGDVVFKFPDSPERLFSQLPGQKHLIIGNHDAKLAKGCYKFFESIDDYAKITDKERKVILFHYPILEWDGYFKGSYHLYGHIHNNTDNYTYEIISKIPRAYNVGVDVNNYKPVTLDELIANKS